MSSFPATLKAAFPTSRFALVTNTTIAHLYRETIAAWTLSLNLVVHVIPDGEQYKTIDTWIGILDTLLQSKFERSSIIIAFGGGVVGDTTGFAAASFLRGVGYVQVPTTLLAMVDSSVGGKTAVDHPMGKNLIGAFHQPRLVFVDPCFLATLPDRVFISGYAELFKNAFFGGRDMFNFILKQHEAMFSRSQEHLLEGIHRSIKIKAGIVEQDEFETRGIRELLNFGHTFAHALERYFNYTELQHGEAVWWGMRCAIAMAQTAGLIETASLPLYYEILSLMPKPVLPSQPQGPQIYKLMFSDKKVSSGKLHFVLPTSPGTAATYDSITKETIRMVLDKIFFEAEPIVSG